ncbi:ribonuclease P protein component [bacterium]|nr:ribonuclease P protein component [bacterium]
MITLTRSKDFDRVFRRGISLSSSEIVLYAFKRSGRFSETRFAFCVSKKFGGAVVRNRIRRRLREICRLNEHKLDVKWDLILLARRNAEKLRFALLEKKFLNLCGRAGILRSAETAARPEELQI